jgi:hypothetical protein
MACPDGSPPSRAASWQVIIGGCGESQNGTGSGYSLYGKARFDYHAGFEKVGDGLFQTTYAHQHLSPDDPSLGFPELWSVTDFARLLLQKRSYNSVIPLMPEPSHFTHNNCGGRRGVLMKKLTRLEPPVLVARYSFCLWNREEPNATRVFLSSSCSTAKRLLHRDCEATRDGTKTALSAHHLYIFFGEYFVAGLLYRKTMAGAVSWKRSHHLGQS